MGRIEHRYATRRLDAYVDDELTGADVDRVTGHLLDCVDCSAQVRFLLRVRAVLLGRSTRPALRASPGH